MSLISRSVIPAQAGIDFGFAMFFTIDYRLRGNDEE
jgi:hypothetical protein